MSEREWLFVRPGSGVPLYVQITQRVKAAIAAGILKPGEQLPTIRDVAVDLTINPNTVARAYRELEGEGLIVSQRGRGTFVADRAPKALSREHRERELQQALDRFLTEVRALGYEGDEIVKALQERLGRGEGDPS